MTLPATTLRRLSADDQVKLDRAEIAVEVAIGVDFNELRIGFGDFRMIPKSSKRQIATQAIYDRGVILATGRFQYREALLARRGDDYALYVKGVDRHVWVVRFSAVVEGSLR